jgi:hypothetical protein
MDTELLGCCCDGTRSRRRQRTLDGWSITLPLAGKDRG